MTVESSTSLTPRCILAFIAGCVLLVAGCDARSKYEKLVERETATGIVRDSLFLGYRLGMPRDSFYDHSWALNRQQLVMQGPQNQSVQFALKNELKHPAKMFYYPDFYEDKLSQMRIRFLYDGWSPWSKALSPDSLQLDVLDAFIGWFGGNEFIVYDVKKDVFGEHVRYVKVDGNRRILISKLSDKEVLAIITDLQAEKALQNDRP